MTKNIQSTLARELQDLSATFRKSQSNYLKRKLLSTAKSPFSLISSPPPAPPPPFFFCCISTGMRGREERSMGIIDTGAAGAAAAAEDDDDAYMDPVGTEIWIGLLNWGC